ncbi:hypothetical protein [Vibrio sp. B1Z05]|uniref:hypothetical protein n=1 Tax=Vibrio sp. B1Z05 TaxID=2654980 RepID=UPI00128E2CBC|nr:hypothetical protein [Vibrio sp. B1Z05]MPW34913.1 hypothetical protein [Vibrio sp. B1Z05]
MLKGWVYSNRKDLLFIVFCWFIIATVMFTKSWENISNLELKDNDDYMRYVQFMDWIKFGNWYLEPMPRFNPEDGVIMHWSRVSDFIPAGLTLLFISFLGFEVASLVAIAVTPLLYLLLFALALFAYVDHYLGKDHRFIGMLFALGSHAISKFFPGSIDHHNLQLIIVALFLIGTPQLCIQENEKWRPIYQGLLIGLSLWIGLDNFILFTSYLCLYTLYSYLYRYKLLDYLFRLCFFATLFTTIAILLNRPISEFTFEHYDSISLPFALCFLAGGFFTYLSNKCLTIETSFNSKLIKGILLFIICFVPIIYIYPQLLKGALADYPLLLREFWLNKVTEAQPMLRTIQKNGFFSSENYFLFFVPALCYPLLQKKNKDLNILYFMLLIQLVLGLLWQVRVMTICFILSAPIQVYVLMKISNSFKFQLTQAIIILSGMPIIVLILISMISPSPDEPEKNTKNNVSAYQQLINSGINSNKIMTGTESGAKILATTHNTIIAAPYHRNINGNSFVIETFLSTNIDEVHKRLIQNNVDFILINNDSQLKIIRASATNDAFINVLEHTELPSWIQPTSVDFNTNSRLFKIIGPNE